VDSEINPLLGSILTQSASANNDEQDAEGGRASGGGETDGNAQQAKPSKTKGLKRVQAKML
jgi:hypothetical protein